MKRIFSLLCAIAALLLAACTQSEYRVVDGVITFDTPARAPGQKSVLGLRTEPMDTVRVGFIGLGMRGPHAVVRFSCLEGVQIKALCDLYPERVDESMKFLASKGLRADAYSGEDAWKELCERDDIDLVYIATPWLHHVPMAVYAMEQGKHVAVEVPAATSLEECWQLVDTAERTQRHCMMLENCVYDFFEMTSLNMAQQGLFGEIIYAQGAYIHDLEHYWDDYQGNWRLDFNQKHRGDVYATHGLGPICQVLNIHRGDRMKRLVAMDTKSINGLKIAKAKMGVDEFANGDHTITLIQTEKEKVIQLQHNVYTPRPYNRLYQLTGTDGFANKYPVVGFSFRPTNIPSDIAKEYDNLNAHNFVSEELKEELLAKYKHPITVELEAKAKEVGGHGGMDFIMDYRLVYCLRNGLPLDQDVYDAAEWSCIGALSAVSLANNSASVAVPDFTRGDWAKISSYQHAFAE